MGSAGNTGRDVTMKLSIKQTTDSTRRFRRRRIPRTLAVVGAAIALGATLAAPAQTASAASDAGAAGAVYLASNAFAGNTIQTFLRRPDGSLTAVGSPVATGGLGSGPGLVVQDDPLGSQNSLLADQDYQRLYAVNAGSDSVSVLSLSRSAPRLVDVKPTGRYPVSVAASNNLLFVLNGVGNSVTGFKVGPTGHLSATQTCALPALPAGDGVLTGNAVSSAQPLGTEIPGQVGFSPDGKRLVVTSKEGPVLDNGKFPFGADLGPGHIYVFNVDTRGGTLANCAAPKTTTLPTNANGGDKFPFSFAWDAKGHLAVLEVFGTATSFTGSALSSYTLGADGSLTPISTSIGNGQAASCWIVRSGNHFFVANYFGDDVSSYSVSTAGRLALLSGTAATYGPGFTDASVDMAVTPNGHVVYQLTPGSALIRPFTVGPTGALTALTPVATGTAAHSGQMGMATADF